MESTLYRPQELAFRTQYAELKERTLAAGTLLPGTPGSLALRKGTGHKYWYRIFYPVPGKPWEEIVCKDGDQAALNAMRDRIAFSEWAAMQVSSLRKLEFQVSDKLTARVLVELHNRQAFQSGLVLVGTLAFMAWLNELGAIAVSARTLDLDLARRQPLQLGLPLPFLATMHSTGLPFSRVPGMPSTAPSTSVKLPGVQGLRVDVLAPGDELGATIAIPEIEWSAQAVPFYDYLLDDPDTGAALAGGHCIPVSLPQAARFVWHKLYSSTKRSGFPEKAEKDLRQAMILAAVLTDTDPTALKHAYDKAPVSMINPVKPLLEKLKARASGHPALIDLLEGCLDHGRALLS